MRRETCGGCGAGRDSLVSFLNLGSSPLANKLPSPDEVADEVFYDLELAVCTTCWLVQLLEVVPAELVFGRDYAFYSSTSPSLNAYHERYAHELMADLPRDALVVEVACNDGNLLRHFARNGYRHLGIDPALGPVTAARRGGMDVWHASLNRDTARAVLQERGAADLVIANHVTAHVTDLHEFLCSIRKMLTADGIAVLEVQYLPDLLVGNQFDHVYHEHRYFFSLSSLHRVVTLAGLDVLDVRLIEPQGGSMRVTLTRANTQNVLNRQQPSVARRLFREQPFRELGVYEAAQAHAERVKERLLDTLTELRDRGALIAGYGMPAKAATLLNFCGVKSDLVDHIVDTTPAKIGRLAPGVSIPVVGPRDRPAPDVFLLLVWNYLAGVLSREAEFRQSGGKLIVPIPVPIVV